MAAGRVRAFQAPGIAAFVFDGAKATVAEGGGWIAIGNAMGGAGGGAADDFLGEWSRPIVTRSAQGGAESGADGTLTAVRQ